MVVAGAIAVALISGLVSYGGAKFARRKDDASATKTFMESALLLIAPLNADIAKLQGRVSSLEAEKARLDGRIADLERDNRNLRGENTGLRQRVTSLESQILALGHTPVNGTAATIITSTTETKTVTHEEAPPA